MYAATYQTESWPTSWKHRCSLSSVSTVRPRTCFPHWVELRKCKSSCCISVPQTDYCNPPPPVDTYRASASNLHWNVLKHRNSEKHMFLVKKEKSVIFRHSGTKKLSLTSCTPCAINVCCQNAVEATAVHLCATVCSRNSWSPVSQPETCLSLLFLVNRRAKRQELPTANNGLRLHCPFIRWAPCTKLDL